jgi:hypothetical protein
MKNKAIVIITALAFFACDNFFHELIPPDGNRIESFSVPGQLSVEIGDSVLTAYVSPNTDLTCLIPSIRVSDGATLLPVTREYVAYAFNDERTFGAAMELYTSGSMTDKIVEMIRSNRTFNRPVMDMPIDFGYPVDFLVISSLGTIRQYKVRVEIDTGEGKFTSFKFDKFYNPDVVRSAVGVIDREAKTITVNVSYPVENIASYQLTPSFETNGARVYLDGTEWRSGSSVINFLKPPDSLDLNNPVYRSQTKILTLKRAGFADAEWTLIVNFSEDPDTSRAITDFRFTKSLNPLINADYMAEEIYHSDSYGSIYVTVYYSGAKPEELRASFISPGTVTVDDEIQISGYSTQDFFSNTQVFFSSVRYVVTSKIGNNVRTYSVRVEILPLSDPIPQITYFSFRTEQNPLLVSNSTAIIDHNSRIILIEAAYDGDSPPVKLIPDFSATGTVTANGVTQTRNTSSVNFSSPVGYIVTNSSNPTLKREYRVEVKFVRNLSSVAEITAFTFYKADNPGLIADVSATVNQRTGEITATLLFETPGGNRTLVPRWNALGRIESGGVAQTSGESGRQFYAPQTYRASSADGVFKRDYTVTIREINNRIYVKHDATGRNDGTNWENAYRRPQNASNDASDFFARSHYSDIMKEVWIAEGTYVVNGTYLTSYMSYIGGFRGNETSLSERVDPANHRAVITGDQGGGRWLNGSIISPLAHYSDGVIFDKGGFCSIEDIVITCANNYDEYPGEISNGAGIGGGFDDSVIVIKGVEFRDLIAADCGGAAAFFDLSSVTITNCTFINTRAGDRGGALYLQNCNVTVTNCNFVNTSSSANAGNAIYFYRCNITQSGNTFTNVSSPQVSIY